VANISFDLTNFTNADNLDQKEARLELFEGPYNYTIYANIMDITTNSMMGRFNIQCVNGVVQLHILDEGHNVEKTVELARLVFSKGD
jgi:hypothetical protein